MSRHDRLTHNAPSSQATTNLPPSPQLLPIVSQDNGPAFSTEPRYPGDYFIPELTSAVAVPTTVINTLPMEDLEFPGLAQSLESFPDDFAIFMDSVPIPRNTFSPSYQPLPTLFPELGFQTPTAANNHAMEARLNDSDLPDNSSAYSPLSPFGSRLPSLQLDELPAQRVRDGSRPRAHPIVSFECREHLVEELAEFTGIIPGTFILPSRHALSRFVTSYFNNFHEHYPFLHVPTLQLESINPELFLAIAALGARYSREPEMSIGLFCAAKAVVMERMRRPTATLSSQNTSQGLSHDFATSGHRIETRSDTEGHKDAIETIQTFVLLIAIATWFHRNPDTYEALSFRSMLDSLIRANLTVERQNPQSQSWNAWILSETAKRTKLVAYCFFNIHTIVFDLPPMMLPGELNLDLPCSERQWKEATETSWRGSFISSISSQDFEQTFEFLFQEDQASRNKPCSGVSTLGGFALIHAIIQRIWLVRNARFPVCGGGFLPLAELNMFEQALKTWSWCWEQDKERSIDPLSPHGPLSFTSTALLRLAYIRINMDLGPTRSLNTWNPTLIAQALYRSPGVQRSDKVTRAALHCAQALSIPIKLGIKFVAKTQVVYWSNQHALCSLECAVLLSKWLEAVTGPALDPPLNLAEGRVLGFLAELIAEANYEQNTEQILDKKRLMGAALVRLWATLYNCDSVWAMLDLIGQSLNAYAALLDEHPESSH